MSTDTGSSDVTSSAMEQTEFLELATDSASLINIQSLNSIFVKSGFDRPDFIIKPTREKKSSVNSIDTRDLADVYISSTFNEPSSVDISKAVKQYVIEGTVINNLHSMSAKISNSSHHSRLFRTFFFLHI
jgi:hypothetical protein